MDKQSPTMQNVAAIDIGSNLIRMIIAEVSPQGEAKVLEQLQRTVRLGQDTFPRGRLSAASIRAAIAVLRDYKKLLDFYRIVRIRAVATSAVREAANSDTFLDRVFIATGLDVEVIDTSEESRLTVSAVRQGLSARLSQSQSNILIAEVGGGSILLTLLCGSEIITSHSLPLGSIRLQEALMTAGDSPLQASEILAVRIENEISGIEKMFPAKKFHSFVALGADARFAARHVGKPLPESEWFQITGPAFGKFLKTIKPSTPEQLVKTFGIPFSDAETVKPALLVYQALMQALRVRTMIVCPLSMRDGLLLDLTRRVTGKEDPALTEGVIHSAQAIAQKYQVNPEHAEQVARLSVQLFDEFLAEHGLTSRHRLLLQIASLLHEAGDFISARSHHKHSYYLIANSEIFGLTRRELMIVALVARYHRRSCPKPTHLEYTALARDDRMIVNKLAALLRIADALDADHLQQVRILRCERRQEELWIFVPYLPDLSLQKRSLAFKADLFEDIYGYKIQLETDLALKT